MQKHRSSLIIVEVNEETVSHCERGNGERSPRGRESGRGEMGGGVLEEGRMERGVLGEGRVGEVKWEEEF